MSYAVSRKQSRDAETIAAWRAHDNAGGSLPAPLAALTALLTGLLGTVVLPTSPNYDDSRKLFNPLFDPHPSIIAYCEVERDVALCLAFAQTHKLPFSVRAGGHSTAGYSGCDGMIIDVGELGDICVEADQNTATVGSGCNFARLNAVLDQYALHVPGGDCGDVRVGGYMQGGGFGFTSRMFGMNCDHVIEVRVMLWDGRVVTANETENHDLWWAMRGGTGGNFGVLLTVQYRLQRPGDMFGFAIRWSLSGDAHRAAAIEALMCLQAKYMRGADFPAFGAQVMLGMQSDKPDMSDPEPWLLVRGLHVGTQAEGQAALQPLLTISGADLQWSCMGPYNDVHQLLMSKPHTIPQLNLKMTNEIKRSRYVARDLARADWLKIIEQWSKAPNRYALFAMELYGGAINAYPRESSAFIHRDVAFDAFIEIFWYDDGGGQPSEIWLDDATTEMDPFWNGHVYQNYPSGAEPDYRANYWGDAFPALLAVKLKYDPRTLFNFAQAILPPNGVTVAAPVWPPKVVAALTQPISYR
jgi:FAD/FMN-containing dehydrogenase